MKYKPKIKYKLMAVLMTAFSFFCLTIPAYAGIWDGLAGGATSDGGFKLTSTPYGYINTDPMAWRVNLYVSGNADGKINKSADTIGGNNLKLVGSLFCISSTYGSEWNAMGQYTYIQTDYTDTTRDQFNSNGYTATKNPFTGDIMGKTYTLPTLKLFESGVDTYTDASSNIVVKAKDLSLFKNQYGLTTNFSEIRTKLTGDESKETTTILIKQLTDINFKGFVSKINESVDANIKKSIAESNGGTIDVPTFKKYLLPDSPDCMVEWALTVAPIYRFECGAPFYCSKASTSVTSTNGLPYVGGYNCVALDAYWFAQADKTSLALGKGGMYAGLTYTSSDGTIKNVWQNQTIGLLSFFLETHAGAVGSAAYSTESSDPHLGVYNNNGVTDQTGWYNLLKSKPSEYAKRGGIAIFTTKIQTPETPVYYHTYTYTLDENNPPDGYNPDQSYTQEQLLQFVEKLPDPEVTVSQGDLPDKNAEKYYPANPQ